MEILRCLISDILREVLPDIIPSTTQQRENIEVVDGVSRVLRSCVRWNKRWLFKSSILIRTTGGVHGCDQCVMRKGSPPWVAGKARGD